MTTPARKTKIYDFLEALLGESKKQKKLIKEINRRYKNKEHWDLDSSFLNPLKEFLDKYFKNQIIDKTSKIKPLEFFYFFKK